MTQCNRFLNFSFYFFNNLVPYKQRCGFGHQFRWRCSGAGANSASTNMIDGGSCSSPIFLQWLDSIWQIKQQFPTHVEFNDGMCTACMCCLCVVPVISIYLFPPLYIYLIF